MNRIAPQFSGVYLWNFKLTQAEQEALAQEAEQNKESKVRSWQTKHHLPEPIKTRLVKETKATSFDIQYLNPNKAVIVTNDRRGDHLELLAIAADTKKQTKALVKLILNPHGKITTTNSQGEGVVFKSVWKITRFFIGIGNFFKRLFGK